MTPTEARCLLLPTIGVWETEVTPIEMDLEETDGGLDLLLWNGPRSGRAEDKRVSFLTAAEISDDTFKAAFGKRGVSIIEAYRAESVTG